MYISIKTNDKRKFLLRNDFLNCQVLLLEYNFCKYSYICSAYYSGLFSETLMNKRFLLNSHSTISFGGGGNFHYRSKTLTNIFEKHVFHAYFRFT